jgi:hypothetical protein
MRCSMQPPLKPNHFRHVDGSLRLAGTNNVRYDISKDGTARNVVADGDRLDSNKHITMTDKFMTSCNSIYTLSLSVWRTHYAISHPISQSIACTYYFVLSSHCGNKLAAAAGDAVASVARLTLTSSAVQR